MAESTVVLHTTGMHCRSCAMNVDLTLDDLEGVTSSETDLPAEKTVVTYDPDAVSVDQIVAAVKEAGYDATVAE